MTTLPASLRPLAQPDSQPTVRLTQTPQHVAIIMDGNGRWARARGRPRLAGHRAGTQNLRRVIERFADYGVKYLTLYAFSTENWARPKREIAGLMALLSRVIKRETSHLHENGIRLLHIGDLEALEPRLQREVREAIKLTENNTGMTLVIAFNYGGRAEIINAVRRMVADRVPVERIDEALFGAYLSTTTIPDPDMIIRTAGEMRISNFLLWQSAYAEFCTTPVFWPDFDIHDIDEALLIYSRRKRRFGGLPSAESDYPSPSLNFSNGNGPTRRNNERQA